MGHPHWPIWDLRIHTPRLELRAAGEHEIDDLVSLLAGGIHDPSRMPFIIPFTDTAPPERERDSYRHFYRCWATWEPDDWHLPLAVYSDGVCVGTQAVFATAFPIRRVVDTGSWLGLRFQGNGFGREMRAAVLHLAFAGLGAERAQTEAFDDNSASQRVTESLGYAPDGGGINPQRDHPMRIRRYALEREAWGERRRDDITIEGLAACRDMFGIDSIGFP